VPSPECKTAGPSALTLYLLQYPALPAGLGKLLDLRPEIQIKTQHQKLKLLLQLNMRKSMRCEISFGTFVRVPRRHGCVGVLGITSFKFLHLVRVLVCQIGFL
jgi:hypothetical protein